MKNLIYFLMFLIGIMIAVSFLGFWVVIVLPLLIFNSVLRMCDRP